MRISYRDKRFGAKSLATIEQANAIIAEYQEAGFTLTLRQLYYQFVSRDLLPNSQKSYSNLGNLISDARLAGLVSWEAIEDRTRWLRKRSVWNEPKEIIDSAVKSYHIDMWDNQLYRPEVWIEKDALVGVIEGVCNELSVPFFACRGYASQSEIWAAGQRLREHINHGQEPLIIHLGDHDPSGIDMTRDNSDRLALFTSEVIQVERIALNMDQVRKYNPPPNPAKITDSRAGAYISRHGNKSWELDALEPSAIVKLVRAAIDDVRDIEKWEEAEKRLNKERNQLKKLMKQL